MAKDRKLIVNLCFMDSSVKELTSHDLRYLIRKNTAYLKGIFSGRVPCRRHDDYSKGGLANGKFWPEAVNIFQYRMPNKIMQYKK